MAIIDRATACLEQSPEIARAELAHLRWKLARALREYQVFKHSHIFDPAIASGSPSLAEAGRRLKIDCIAGGETFFRYVRFWSSKDVVANWGEFRAATRDLGRNLRDHVSSEGTQIRLLLAEATKRGLVSAREDRLQA
ncbi:hypothetical protein [Sphingomonas lenta]|uniref:hypothetical protein n=1 Tax=Sphingomonas lenta TaxID=1141887 RepID=UPI001140AB6F|nr:hypothetical protein [Sphingomonas lenta]